jgi:hypothetical protein
MLFVMFCELTKQNILDYPFSFYSLICSPSLAWITWEFILPHNDSMKYFNTKD